MALAASTAKGMLLNCSRNFRASAEGDIRLR
jgi:hypothetical protein